MDTDTMFRREQLVDHVNAYRTQSLFIETNGTTRDPIMTLNDHDLELNGTVLYSLKKIYMEEADPEEYRVAIRVFGSWAHWERLLQNKKIFRKIQEYRKELEVKIRSDAVRALISTAALDGAKGTSAAKYVAEKGWEKRKAGAPTKAEVKSELKVQADMDSELQEDMKRLNIKVIK
jgi:hypothetical protein